MKQIVLYQRLVAFLLLWLAISAASAHTSPGPSRPGGPTTAQLAQALTPDGSLQPGAHGSFDATGYTMTTAPDGHPIFLPASPQRTTGAGDENWADGFGVPGTSDNVFALAADGNGNVYAGGSFTTAGGVAANYVAKWNGRAWSALNVGLDGPVYALAVDGSGNVYAGGSFTTAGGVAASNVAKWNGSTWAAFGTGVNGDVNGLVIDGSGNLYAGGYFTTAGGVAANYVAKWNGSTWAALGTGVNNWVQALAVDGSGNVYAGGYFTTAGGVAASNVAKWNGSAWSALGTGVNSDVYALAVDGSGNLYAGGSFTTAGGVAANRVAKWNGSTWAALGTGMSGSVRALAVDGSGNLYAGGSFTTAGGVTANRVAKWNGSTWAALGTGLYYGFALAVDGSGNVYAGGNFTTAGGVAANYVAKWNGSAWAALGAGIDSYVQALAVDGSGNVYAGGSFTTAGGVVANYVAKWNGSAWSALGTGMNGPVYALAVDGSGNLYAEGNFTAAGGVAANYVAKWNGSAWATLGTGLSSYGYALAVDGSGNLYAGGNFTSAGGVAARFVAKWNGSAWSALGTGIGGSVRALAVDGSGNVYAGGIFTTAGGVAASNVAKWNGSAWSALGAGTNYLVYALTVDGSGNLYAGGAFTMAGGVAAGNVAKWNGSAWAALGTGMNGDVQALVMDGNGNMYVGGNFTTADGAAASNVAKWNGSVWSALGTGLNNYGGLALALTGSSLYAGGYFTAVGDGSKPMNYFGRYTLAVPTLASLSPTSGPVGTNVTLTGTNLTGATGVSFNGTAATSFTVVNGTTVTTTVPAGATTGSVTVTTPGGISNGLTFTVQQSTTISSITTTTASPTNAASISYSVTFAANVAGLSRSNFTLSPTVTGASVSGVNGSGTTYTVVVNTGTGDGTLQLNLDNSTGLTPTVSNVPFAGPAITIDKTAPTAAIGRQNPTATTTNVTAVTFRVTFSEAVTGVSTSSFTLNTSGTSGTIVTATSVGGSTSVYDVVVNSVSGNGTLGILLKSSNSGVMDLAGNAATGGVAGPTYTIDQAAPTVTSLTSSAGTSGSSTSTSPFAFTVTFSELVAGLSTSGITVTNGTVTTAPSGTTPGTTFTFTVTPTTPSLATSVTIAAGAAQDAAGNNSVASPAYTLTYVTGTTWTGIISPDWFTGANWTAGVPTATLDATISASAIFSPLITNNTATTRNLTLNGGTTLNMSGGTLDVRGNLTNNSALVATGGTVVLGTSTLGTIVGSGTTNFWSLRVESNGALLATSAGATVQQVLTLNGGFSTNGNSFTLLSNATNTALVVNNGSNVVSGNVTVQRYIVPDLNPNLGYRHVSSPISNATVGNLATGSFAPVVNPTYNTSATPGQVQSFPTVYGYDQSRLATTTNNLATFDKGWYSPAALSDPLTVGKGYTVNLAAGQTWSFTGTLNNGNVSQTLARNSGATAADAGLALVGNPYPAPLDWSQVATADRPNVDGIIYVFASNDPSNPYTGSYSFYQSGFGNASPVLPLGQAFFVHVTPGQTSGTLNLNNSHRAVSYTNPTYHRPAETRPVVHLTLHGASSALTDDTFVYFEAGATDSFDAQYDGEKLPNPSGLNLSTSLSATQRLCVNGLAPLAAQRVVPLAVGVPVAGSYTLTAAELLNLSTMPVYLRDRQTGALLDLAQQPSYQFTVPNASVLLTGRFELVFSPQAALATAPAALAAQVGLYPNPTTATAFVELPADLGRAAVGAQLVDALGRSVRSLSLPAQGTTPHRLDLATLATGVYTLHLQTSAGVIVRKLVVQ